MAAPVVRVRLAQSGWLRCWAAGIPQVQAVVVTVARYYWLVLLVASTGAARQEAGAVNRPPRHLCLHLLIKILLGRGL